MHSSFAIFGILFVLAPGFAIQAFRQMRRVGALARPSGDRKLGIFD